MFPTIISKRLTDGGVQLLIGGLKVGESVTQFARLPLGFFEVGVECGDSLTQVGAGCRSLTTKDVLHDLADSLSASARPLDSLRHLLHGLEDGHRAVVQLARHLLPVNTHLRQCIARSLGHQSEILDAHHDGVHILVGEDAALRVMNDGYQLGGTNACIAERRCELLDHGEQLRSVALNHAAHAVLDELHGLVAALAELSHQCVGGVDDLTEVYVVGVDHCPCYVRHAVG